MYTKKIFPMSGMIKWTRRYIYVFTLLAIIPVVLFDLLGWKWLHLPWLPIGLLGTAVAFIMGFKNSASYDRAWEARKIWGGIVNASRSWTIMVKDFIKNHQDGEKQLSEQELKEIHRVLVHRHVAWMTALRYQLRKSKPWEAHLWKNKSNIEFRRTQYDIPEELIPVEEAIDPYLSKEEKKVIFEKGNQASQLLGIQSQHLKELKDQNLIKHYEYVEMERMLVEFYTLQGKSERIKNFPYPRQFATLNYIFIWVFILLLPFGIMEAFENIGDGVLEELNKHLEHTSLLHHFKEFIGEHFVWLSIPFSVLISWVFHVMELVGENTENPFEGGPNDVPITSMARGIEIDIRQLIDDTDIPKPYEWRNNIEM
ncbi:UPF0187 protein [Flavobacteriaceae bacterium UJ101]|nr:UPF0187 protein [Flavobacteriaceae bacterium UJ101]